MRSHRPKRRVFENKQGFWISATMPNRTPPGRKAECFSACHLAEMAINDEKTDGKLACSPIFLIYTISQKR
jgi:hypothetical protein